MFEFVFPAMVATLSNSDEARLVAGLEEQQQERCQYKREDILSLEICSGTPFGGDLFTGTDRGA